MGKFLQEVNLKHLFMETNDFKRLFCFIGKRWFSFLRKNTLTVYINYFVIYRLILYFKNFKSLIISYSKNIWRLSLITIWILIWKILVLVKSWVYVNKKLIVIPKKGRSTLDFVLFKNLNISKDNPEGKPQSHFLLLCPVCELPV